MPPTIPAVAGIRDNTKITPTVIAAVFQSIRIASNPPAYHGDHDASRDHP
jgi:hypothetical protein